MAERKDTDALLMDWLYDEPDRQGGDEEVEPHQGELDSYRRIREAFRELPEEEPPPGLSAILMHEAAKRAPAPRARAVTVEDGEERGFFAWLGRIFGSMMAHPAATAAATLVLVAGVAGSLYVRGHRSSEPEVGSHAPAPGAVADESAAVPPEVPATPPAAATAADPSPDEDLKLQWDNGYSVTLADGVLDSENEEAKPLAKDKAENRNREKLGLVARPESTVTPKAPARKPSKERLSGEVQANVVSGADQLVVAGDDDAVTEVGNVDRGDAPKNAPPPPSPKQQQQSPRGGGTSGSTRDAKSDSNSIDGWARDKHAQLEAEAKRDECAAAARTANDIREKAPAYYNDNVAGSTAYKRCSSKIVAERKRRAAERQKATSAEPADHAAAEPSAD